MEEVLEKFDSALKPITGEFRNNADEKSSFESLYKNWGRLGNQEERRKEILNEQKSDRNSKLDQVRGLLDLVTNEEEHIFKSNRKAYYRPNIFVAGFNKTSSKYNNVLMLSEWMIEKPQDFHENWLVVPCPKGVRTLVVANQGRTKFFSKNGRFNFESRTALPGGHRLGQDTKTTGACVLDGFYQKKNNTLYVLDILVWNNQHMTDGETEFRHYWIKTKFGELPQLKYVNNKNGVIFTILPFISCAPESFSDFMSSYPPFECNFPPLDGLLFYHKKAHYFAGETPLVGWLYPYMVPEILGADINVHELYLRETPKDYVNQNVFIQKFEEEYEKKRGRSRSSMDTSDINEEKVQNFEQTGSKQDCAIGMESEEPITGSAEEEDNMESGSTHEENLQAKLDEDT